MNVIFVHDHTFKKGIINIIHPAAYLKEYGNDI